MFLILFFFKRSFYSWQEITLLSGVINGINTIFVWTQIPTQVILNGQILRVGVGYTLLGTTITLTSPPYIGDYLWTYGNY